MKKLNGNLYFERDDIDKFFKSACLSLIDPSILENQSKHTFKFDTNMLYVLPEDELSTIKEGIKKLNNTISWELTSETAIKLKSIEECYHSLRTPASNKISYKEYHQTSLKNTTTDIMTYYENWLLDIGNDILFFFFTR
jgi:hypothetical protein